MGTPVREMTALTEQAADGNSSSSTQMELVNSERVLVKKKNCKISRSKQRCKLLCVGIFMRTSGGSAGTSECLQI